MEHLEKLAAKAVRKFNAAQRGHKKRKALFKRAKWAVAMAMKYDSIQ